jgi:phosphoserine phosphatase
MAEAKPQGLTQDELRWILGVTRKLAAPFDLNTMLEEVVDAAKGVLDAEGGTVWLYDAVGDQLVLRVARGLDPIRIPADKGIVGECVRTRRMINVPDCYADPRFNRDIDKATGYTTRCMLTLPLVGHDESLVGALQIVNKKHGVFGLDDETIADALAAQCAVALQRVQMTERLIAGEKLKQEISVARDIQMGTLPKAPPAFAEYDIAGIFRPADETGGDTYDFVRVSDDKLMVLMGDATGHGIGPALSATNVRAMLRVAQRIGTSLDETYRHINDQLCEDLPADRFVTAFLGLLDNKAHELRYHSGGQGPLLHYRAEDDDFDFQPPTTFPMGAMTLATVKAPRLVRLGPGDLFALISDGVYEYEDASGRQFGEQGVADIIRRHRGKAMPELIGMLLMAIDTFAGGAPQQDDVTIVLIRRLPKHGAPRAVAIDSQGTGAGEHGVARTFPRSFQSLEPVFEMIRKFFEDEGFDADQRYAFDFTVEELLTNMVKYNPTGGGELGVALARRGDEVVCTLTDPDCPRWDPTIAPDVDVNMSLDERRPGGLGLHLIRRMVDEVEYSHDGRTGRIVFSKRFGKRKG